MLRQIALEVAEGDFVTIMGPSGSGKSTLLAILGMLDGEFSGEYWFDGESVHGVSSKQRSRLNKENIGFVFQHFHLLDDLTVYENLDIPLSYRDVPRKEREARVAEILDRFQIVGKKDLYPAQLSGGQQQQVAVARAVIAQPRVVLADEPTGSLHWSQGEQIMNLLRKLNEDGTTIIQVSHDERVAAFGRRVIQLADGWIA
ncbi:MAG TPA: ABC transporter ATP-binding protein [Opitutaceae bacterium]